MQRGAFDYLTKPFDVDELSRSLVERALERDAHPSCGENLDGEIARAGRAGRAELVGTVAGDAGGVTRDRRASRRATRRC